MHGVHLRPGLDRARAPGAALQPQRRAAQTFLWWANVAAEVHDDYQSFFPADVHHGRRPRQACRHHLPGRLRLLLRHRLPARQGDDTRADSPFVVPGDRLDWPRNIPVPTSYMCVGSRGDFFGGYDHRAGAGFVHWADHDSWSGKKQWTWGDAPFGHAWNRNLADDGSAYIELMAGAFTDNQPDFSHLAPGETKSFSQYWYPLAGTGVGRGQHPRRGAGRRGRRRRDHAPCSTRPPTSGRRGCSVRRRRRDVPATTPASTLSPTSGPRSVCSTTRLGPGARRSRGPTAARAGHPAEATAAAELQPAVEPVAAGRDRQRRGAVPDRSAPGAVPARHPLARAVLGRGPDPRPRPLAIARRARHPALPRGPLRRGRAATCGRRSPG